MNKHLYAFATALFGVSALLGVYFVVVGLRNESALLVGIGVLIAYVCLDNFFCKERIHRYVGKEMGRPPASETVKVRRVSTKRRKRSKRKRK